MQNYNYDIITGDKFLKTFPEHYYKTDCIIFRSSILWRNKPLYPPSKNLNLIISGHSDYEITSSQVEYFTPQIWYTVNKQTLDPRVHSIPLGIPNDTNETEKHHIFGNIDLMIRAMNTPQKNENMVYMNFNICTYPQERQFIFDFFKNNTWVTQGILEISMVGRERYLRDIRNHTFVLCPRGNGVDTHRLWETLYMGSIPIVKKDVAFDEFQDLPICFINRWEDVTLDFLNKESQRILSTSWNMNKLDMSYWIQKIKESL